MEKDLKSQQLLQVIHFYINAPVHHSVWKSLNKVALYNIRASERAKTFNFPEKKNEIKSRDAIFGKFGKWNNWKMDEKFQWYIFCLFSNTVSHRVEILPLLASIYLHLLIWYSCHTTRVDYEVTLLRSRKRYRKEINDAKKQFF